MKFLSPEVAIYLYKSAMHAWNTVVMPASGCYLDMLDKLQTQIRKTVVPSLGASLELLAHH